MAALTPLLLREDLQLSDDSVFYFELLKGIEIRHKRIRNMVA